jgi:ribosomal protein S6--L-glutamate ligase
MEKFTEFLKEAPQEEPIQMQDLHIVILGLGDEEGTFADLIQKVAKKYNMKTTMVDVSEAYIASKDVEIGEVKIRNINGKDLDIVIKVENSLVFVRAGAIKTLTSQALVSSLQTLGFFLVNDLESMLVCDNKMSNIIALERNNISVPRTSIVNNVKSIEQAHDNIGGKFPVIIKTLKGTQGVGVSKVNDMASLVSVCQSLWKFNADLLIQEYFELKSDIRTLVVNNKIIGSAERIKVNDKEFRNNVHLGADTRPYQLSKIEKELVINAARSVGASYCGVDHCKVGKDFYILEVNGSPGIRSHFMGYDEDGNPTKKITDEQTLESIIKVYSAERQRRPLMRQEVGYIETIVFEGMENNPVRAKFDTGNSASASMLHVDQMQIDGDRVRWKKNGYTFESDIVDISEPRRGLEPFDKRPVIEHGITFNNKKYTIELGLTEKDTASEMLVNRKLMTQLRVAVHPNQLFLVSNPTKRNDNTDH